MAKGDRLTPLGRLRLVKTPDHAPEATLPNAETARRRGRSALSLVRGDGAEVIRPPEANAEAARPTLSWLSEMSARCVAETEDPEASWSSARGQGWQWLARAGEAAVVIDHHSQAVHINVTSFSGHSPLLIEQHSYAPQDEGLGDQYLGVTIDCDGDNLAAQARVVMVDQGRSHAGSVATPDLLQFLQQQGVWSTIDEPQ